MPKIEINGQTVEVAPGATLLDAACKAGIDIPTLCHDPRLHPAGECRLCNVEVAGDPHPHTACTSRAAEGMRVTTHTPELEAFRRTMLGWMAEKVPPETCAALPDKELHRLFRAYAVEPKGATSPIESRDLSHTYIQVDMAQCIDCFRCVRICDEVQGQFVWHAVGRGADTRVVPGDAANLAESDCVSCGACVDTCPTGALTDVAQAPLGGDERRTKSTCVYCGVGCELEIVARDGRIAEIHPARDAPVNKGHLCVKGRYAFAFNEAPDRVTAPLKRNGSGWTPMSLEQALDESASTLRRILDEHGPDSIGVIGSARATNEENYLLQKFARVVLGTNNIDCCARVCHTPTAAAMKAMLGTGASTNSFDDIERSNLFLIAGANPTENHPVVGARIKQRVLRGGAKLIVIDPRRTELAAMATIHLALRPGTNLPLLNALAHVIVTEDLTDRKFVADRVAEWDQFRHFIADWTPERAAEICGLAADDIRAAARLYASTSPAMCFHGLGVTEHTQGTEGVMALVNLALLTGNIGKPGSGINPLRGQNNVQGAAHMGCDPAILTGSVAIDERRALFESVWNATIPRQRGLDLMGMIDAAAAGRIKALWVVGYDIWPTLANNAETRRALERLEFILVEDLFITETAREFGHMILPAASVFEKDGTFMNAERRIQRVRKAVNAPGEAWSDWRIVSALAERMGRGEAFAFDSAEAIWNEIRAVWPEAGGITYPRLENGGLQWPCRDENSPGTEILHVSDFARSHTAPLTRIDYTPTPERVSAEFPFLLSTGRTLYQFNAGTMTMRTPNVKLRPTDTLDISPTDAEILGLVSGDRVRMRSRHGEVEISVRLTDGVKQGELFATFHDPRVALNRLTSPERDRIVHAPEYKVTAVRIERLA
ncbi:formate dehydrogenase subunit alpha [Parvibaculum sp.]|uniref:formate dehydrogenase subunit alpha n=1 Tax=Parvibaculum sp. TaxID=2024848 RepID=UPI00320E1F2C